MPTLAIDINIITHELQKGKKYFRKAVRVMAKKTVDAAEWIELIKLIKQLTEPLKREMCMITEGARFVSDKLNLRDA